MAGMDVNRFLATDDQLERNLMQRIANRALELQFKRDERAAILTRNQIGELLGAK